MRILVIDNGGQWTHREWRVLRDLGVEVEIVPNNTPLEDIKADGLVLSGGAPRVGVDAEKMGKCGDYLDKAIFPILGSVRDTSSWPPISVARLGLPKSRSSARP